MLEDPAIRVVYKGTFGFKDSLLIIDGICFADFLEKGIVRSRGVFEIG